ncbi:MAG: hypothetical protein ACYDCQ_20850 [Dehalococcoidia bacterium]
MRDLVQAAFVESCRTFEPRLRVALDQRIADVRKQVEELQLLQGQLNELHDHLEGECSCDHPAGECSGCSLLGEEGANTVGCSCTFAVRTGDQ